MSRGRPCSRVALAFVLVSDLSASKTGPKYAEVDVKASLTNWGRPVARKYRNTPRAHAESLARLAREYDKLASEHRTLASAVSRASEETPPGRHDFTYWIFQLTVLAAETERLLAFEVELARKHGTTWEGIGEALGVSKQAAHDRFSTRARWTRSRRIAQLSQARWADDYRYLRELREADGEAVPPLKRLRARGSAPPSGSW